MRKIFLALSLMIALLVPAGMIAWHAATSIGGKQWDIPIGGYDPRDMLRGQYIQFTYQFPGGFCIENPMICSVQAGQPQRYYIDEDIALPAEEIIRDNPEKIFARVRVRNGQIRLNGLRYGDDDLRDVARQKYKTEQP